MPENLEHADDIYAAIVLLDDTPPTPGALGIGEIVRFVTGRLPSMTGEQTRYLFSRPDLRRSYAEMKREMSVTSMPSLAAASVGETLTRPVTGGSITISDSPYEGQVNVTVRLDPDMRGHRIDLILEHPTDGFERLDFSFGPDDEGIIREVLDESDTRSARILALLKDTDTEGWLVRHQPPGP